MNEASVVFSDRDETIGRMVGLGPHSDYHTVIGTFSIKRMNEASVVFSDQTRLLVGLGPQMDSSYRHCLYRMNE